MEGGLDIVFFSISFVAFILTIYRKWTLQTLLQILFFAQVLSNVWHIYYGEGDCSGSAYDCIFDSYEITVTSFIAVLTILSCYYLYKVPNIYIIVWVIFDIVWFIVGLSTQNWELYNKYAVIISVIKLCALM